MWGGADRSWEACGAVSDQLAEALGTAVTGELDVKFLDSSDPLLRYFVVRDGCLLAGDPQAYQEFKAFAFRDYLDSWDLRRLERRMIRHKQQALAARYGAGRDLR